MKRIEWLLFGGDTEKTERKEDLFFIIRELQSHILCYGQTRIICHCVLEEDDARIEIKLLRQHPKYPFRVLCQGKTVSFETSRGYQFHNSCYKLKE